VIIIYYACQVVIGKKFCSRITDIVLLAQYNQAVYLILEIRLNSREPQNTESADDQLACEAENAWKHVIISALSHSSNTEG